MQKGNRSRLLRRSALAGIAVLALGLSGCGGDSSPTSPTGGSGAASLPTTTVLTQGTFSLGSVAEANAVGLPADAGRQEFNVSGAGRLDATVNWTFTTNPVGFGIYQGACTFDQFYANACAQIGLVAAATSPKPARLTVNASAGLHTIVIVNAGATSESGTFEVTLTR